MGEIVDIPIGSIGDITVDEANGTFTVVIAANLFGNPEQATLSLSVAQILGGIASGVTNPILRQVLTWAVTLL